jgi:NIMA (never in mitosis gene a)-related kinase
MSTKSPPELCRLDEFEVLRKLGSGAYSSVFNVKRIEDGKEYALKKVRMDVLSEKEQQNAVNEVRILASVDHPNVIQYKDVFIDKPSNSLCIVMEYADNGDLY